MTIPQLTAALGAINQALPSDASPADEINAAKCRALMVGYDARWSGAEWETIAAEEQVTLPLVNPQTGRTSRNWDHTSIHDGVIRGYGKLLGLEHKTTSGEIADPSSMYWRRLQVDGQVSKYALDNWQLGRKLGGTLYDVIRKPAIRPKRLSKKSIDSIFSTHRYEGCKVSDDTWQEVVEGLDTENVELYELRLGVEVLDKPDRYYQRRTIHRLDHELAEYADELWSIGKEITRARATGRHYRNSAACMNYGQLCEYMAICSGEVDTPEVPDDYEPSRTLSHSRISLFQTCRRKHHYRYDLGIKPEKKGEALFIGSFMHLALEAWWLTGNQNKGVAHDHSNAANSVASRSSTAAV